MGLCRWAFLGRKTPVFGVKVNCVRESFKTPSLACQVDSTLWVILIAQGSRLLWESHFGRSNMLVEEELGAAFASFVCVCLKIIEGWI